LPSRHTTAARASCIAECCLTGAEEFLDERTLDQAVAPAERQFEVLQAKEKFGGLRFCVNCRRDEAMRLRIGIAADESFRACWVCGQPGTLREERLEQLCAMNTPAGKK